MLYKLTERENFFSKTLTTLMASYYVYDVQYPKEHDGILQLMQDALLRVTEEKPRRSTRVRNVVAEVLARMEQAASL